MMAQPVVRSHRGARRCSITVTGVRSIATCRAQIDVRQLALGHDRGATYAHSRWRRRTTGTGTGQVIATRFGTAATRMVAVSVSLSW